MSKESTLARPYAQAAFSVAAADDTVAQWAFFLRTLAALASTDAIAALYARPDCDEDQFLNAVMCVAAEVMADQLPAIAEKANRFVRLLMRQDRLMVAPALSNLFDERVDAAKGTVSVAVTSASTLSTDEKAAFESALATRFASQVSVEFKTDSDLIAGSEIRAGNWVLDGSVRGRLSRLAAHLSA